MEGIYKITNLVNKKVYVGQSVNLEERKYRHFLELAGNRHDNSHLQSAFNKYGKENFVFEIIESFPNGISKEGLTNREDFWIKQYNALDRNFGYNGRDAGSKGKMTAEIKQKISASNRGKTLSEEHKRKLSLSHKNKIPWNKGLTTETDPRILKYIHKNGFKHSEETLQKMSAKLKGRKHSEETKIKIGNALRGKKYKKRPPISEDTRLKLSIAAKLDWQRRKMNGSSDIS